uniref:Protein kinase domain-containing protein n=1 Tax=Arundo donax TaxID=35708 RepID=A0A0A8XN46_ARUDO
MNKMDSESSRHNKLESILQDRSLEPHSIALEDLRKITNNFSEEQLLGEGGFGKVYKGEVQNGDTIAVKMLTSTMLGIKAKQFENEMHHLMRLKHPNVVQLVGYCSETEKVLVEYNGKYVYAEKSEKLLCLEYLPKGSLRGHLSDESSGLDWDTRYKVIEGICYGLHYLHEEWKVTPIIHMDLKPANILLDDNMVPKIADFGLSRIFGEEKTRTCTTSRDGTLGYMAPEYINKGIITKKLDIFSLGVIIIEIMTGHKDYPDEDNTSYQKFIELVLKNWINRLEKEPGYTSREIDCQQIRRCIQIGLDCVKFDRTKRPTTVQIIEMLRFRPTTCKIIEMLDREVRSLVN